jgi:hypothetical protein
VAKGSQSGRNSETFPVYRHSFKSVTTITLVRAIEETLGNSQGVETVYTTL